MARNPDILAILVVPQLEVEIILVEAILAGQYLHLISLLVVLQFRLHSLHYQH